MTPLVPAGLNSSPPGWSPTWPAADRDSAEAEFQPGGIPYSIALDSAGDVWTANNSGNPASVTQLPAPVTASTIAQIYHPADAALSDCLELHSTTQETFGSLIAPPRLKKNSAE